MIKIDRNTFTDDYINTMCSIFMRAGFVININDQTKEITMFGLTPHDEQILEKIKDWCIFS